LVEKWRWGRPSSTIVRFTDHRLQVQQDLIEARLKYPRDRVFGLPGIVAKRSTGAELADAHVAACAGNDLVCETAEILAGEVLVALVGRSGQAPLVERRVRATAPGALPSLLLRFLGDRFRVSVLARRDPWSTCRLRT